MTLYRPHQSSHLQIQKPPLFIRLLICGFPLKPTVSTLVDIVEQGRVPILFFSFQQIKYLRMQLDMRHDRVLISCEALGLHHVQATQASSSHIVIDLAAMLRTLSNSERNFPCALVGDSEMALGTCPACAGRHRPHTYAEGRNKATTSVATETVPPKDSIPAEGTSLDRVLVDPLLVDVVVHPNASSSSDPRPPGLEPQLGAGPDTMPRERPVLGTQLMEVLVPKKDTSAAMKGLRCC
jgi:hypothetical protein